MAWGHSLSSCNATFSMATLCVSCSSFGSLCCISLSPTPAAKPNARNVLVRIVQYPVMLPRALLYSTRTAKPTLHGRCPGPHGSEYVLLASEWTQHHQQSLSFMCDAQAFKAFFPCLLSLAHRSIAPEEAASLWLWHRLFSTPC